MFTAVFPFNKIYKVFAPFAKIPYKVGKRLLSLAQISKYILQYISVATTFRSWNSIYLEKASAEILTIQGYPSKKLFG